MWEDAAANSVGNDGVDMPADVQHDKKRKKKSVYDGRTKEGRKFVEKMLARRKAKEINASKQNAASVSMEEVDLDEVKIPNNYAAMMAKKKKQKATLAKHNKRMIKVARDSIKKYQDKKDTKEANESVNEAMKPSQVRSAISKVKKD